jgi:plastocyanin
MKALLPILAIVLVAGCVGQAANPGDAQQPPQAEGPQLREFSLVIFHTRYEPASFTVNQGDTVRLLARTSSGTESHMHGVTIDEYGINELVISSSQAKTIEFVADRAGTFTIYCKTCWDGPFGTGHPPIQATLSVQG